MIKAEAVSDDLAIDFRDAQVRSVLVRLRYHEPTKEYMSRRMGEGMTKPEVIRCLKRYVARQVYSILRDMGRRNLAASPN